MTHAINGHGIVQATIKEPQVGVWVADVAADVAENLTGSATIEIDGETWIGTIYRGGLESGTWRGVVVGGTCGLRTEIDPKNYVNTPFSVIVGDLIDDCGETLSSDSDSLIFDIVSNWQRAKEPASFALRQVTERLGLHWRTLRDGTVWVGTEEYTDVEPGDELGEDPAEGATIYGPTTPFLRPGQRIGGRPISHVTTRASSEGVTQMVRFSASSGAFDDRLRTSIEAIIEQKVGRRLRYAFKYPCTVAFQALDGTLELIPDDDIIKGSGLGSVTIRHGQPGYQTKVLPGAKCMVGFEAGDPARPYVSEWIDGSSVLEVEFDGGAEDISRTNDAICAGFINFATNENALYFSRPAPGDPDTPLGSWTTASFDSSSQTPDNGAIQLIGYITAGNSKLKA